MVTLAEYSPDVSLEWHPKKNGELTPKDVSFGSGMKVWWLGKCGHEWQASIVNRVRGRNCPYCSNKKILFGFNDLQTAYPDISKEWDVELNKGISPSEVSKASSKKYWWKCSNGHRWQSSISNRTRLLPNGKRIGCPYCSGHKVLEGFNDLATIFPEIAKEWHPTKNNNLKPTEVTKGCDMKVWWLCQNNHSFQATIGNRTAKKGTNCPYCSNKKVLPGYNDLLSCYPGIACEWDYDKNGDIKPDAVIKHSEKIYYWRCEKGHSWKARVSQRTRFNTGCPVCAGGTSFQEQAIVFYLSNYFDDIINLDREALQGTQLDIYIPSIATAIEYDGLYYHKDKKRQEYDEVKNKLCQKNKIILIRLREEGLPLMNESEYLKIISVK